LVPLFTTTGSPSPSRSKQSFAATPGELSLGRPIEHARKTNVIVKAFTWDADPDRSVSARFISSRDLAAKDIFARAPLKCHALGLTDEELVRHRRAALPGWACHCQQVKG
jgi:hypothetical protein